MDPRRIYDGDPLTIIIMTLALFWTQLSLFSFCSHAGLQNGRPEHVARLKLSRRSDDLPDCIYITEFTKKTRLLNVSRKIWLYVSGIRPLWWQLCIKRFRQRNLNNRIFTPTAFYNVLTQSRTVFNLHGCVRGEGSVNIYILCGRSCLLFYVA